MADLTGVKVGDRAAYRIVSEGSVEVVARITRTLAFTQSGARFKIDTGCGYGWPVKLYIAEIDTGKPEEENANENA